MFKWLSYKFRMILGLIIVATWQLVTIIMVPTLRFTISICWALQLDFGSAKCERKNIGSWYHCDWHSRWRDDFKWFLVWINR